METRFLPLARAGVQLQKRADNKRSINGYGAVFYDGTPGSEYQLWSNCVERIMPGAFDKVIADKQDVRGLFNHNPDYILGRAGAGTMKLSIDERGLAYEIDAPDTQWGRDVLVSLERQDITGSSFSFIAEKVMWEMLEDGREARNIFGAIVYDVGPVTWPAYEATTAGVRSKGDMTELQKERQEWRDKVGSVEADEIDVRLRLMQLD